MTGHASHAPHVTESGLTPLARLSSPPLAHLSTPPHGQGPDTFMIRSRMGKNAHTFAAILRGGWEVGWRRCPYRSVYVRLTGVCMAMCDTGMHAHTYAAILRRGTHRQKAG